MSGTPIAAAPWWKRLLTLEPALVRSFASVAILVGTNVGLNVTDQVNRAVTVTLAILALVPLVQAWWTRPVVTPYSQVVQKAEPNGDIVAGPASTLPTGIVIRRKGDELGTIRPL